MPIIDPEYLVISPVAGGRIYFSHTNSTEEDYNGGQNAMAVLPAANVDPDTLRENPDILREALQNYPDNVMRRLETVYQFFPFEGTTVEQVLQEHQEILARTLRMYGMSEDEIANVSEKYGEAILAANSGDIEALKQSRAAEPVVREFLTHKTESVLETALQDGHYTLYPAMKTLLQTHLTIVTDEIGAPELTNSIPFKIVKYLNGPMGGFANLNSGDITAYDNLLRRLLKLNASEPTEAAMAAIRQTEIRLHDMLHEETTHIVDFAIGTSVKPRWQALALNLFNDPEKQSAWAELNASRGKAAPSEYYDLDFSTRSDPAILSTELLVDLLQTEQRKTQELGSRVAARQYIADTFGNDAIDFMDDFNTTARAVNAQQLASRSTSPVPAITTTPATPKTAPAKKLAGFLDGFEADIEAASKAVEHSLVSGASEVEIVAPEGAKVLLEAARFIR